MDLLSWLDPQDPRVGMPLLEVYIQCQYSQPPVFQADVFHTCILTPCCCAFLQKVIVAQLVKEHSASRESKGLLPREMWVPHGCECEQRCLMGCCAVRSGRR
jgi:hypothetical protein